MGSAAKALAPLKSALAIAPDQPETLLALGDAYALTHQYASSVKILRKALKPDPDSEDVGSRLAVTYLEWAASVGRELRKSPTLYGRLLRDEGLAAEHSEMANDEFRKTVDSAPDSMEARLSFAYFLMANQSSAKNLEASRGQIEAARQQAPNNPDVMAASVRLAIAENDLPRALAELRSLIGTDPPFVVANADTLGAGLPADMAQEISASARKALHQSAAPAGFSSKISVLQRTKSKRRLASAESAEYASALWHLHRYEEAQAELLERPHRTDAEEYWLFRSCGTLAKQRLEQTVQAHPDSARTHLLLANLAVQQEDLGSAGKEYQAALELRPEDPEIRLLYVRYLETAGKLKKALEEAKRGADEFPRHAGLNAEAGNLIIHFEDDPAEAARFLKRSIQADPKPVLPHVDLSAALMRLEQMEDAIREINLVLSSDDDGSLHYRLAQCYRRTGRADEAAKALAESQRIQELKLQRDRDFADKGSRK